MIYLTDRRQYVQINDRSSERTNVSFGVPQGSILGPVLFGHLTFMSTTYMHTYDHYDDYDQWLSRLALIPKKTKVMLLSTPQMSKTHGLAGQYINPCANGKVLTLMLTFCLFGLEVHENLN